MAKKREMTWQAMFADRVQLNDSGCLEFTGYRNSDGYGCLTVNRVRMGAHRLSYILNGKDLIEGQVVMHRCDNPCCVNPDHLLAGSVADNVLDMEMKGRARKVSGETHCRAKITESDVRLIRSSSISGSQLARSLGISDARVSQIRRGVGWSEVGASHGA